MTTPWQRYQIDLERDDFTHDVAQEQAVLLLQQWLALMVRTKLSKPSLVKTMIQNQAQTTRKYVSFVI